MQTRAALGRPALALQLRRPLQTRQAAKVQRFMPVRAAMAGAGAGDDPYQVRAEPWAGTRTLPRVGRHRYVKCATQVAIWASACSPPPPPPAAQAPTPPLLPLCAWPGAGRPTQCGLHHHPAGVQEEAERGANRQPWPQEPTQGSNTSTGLSCSAARQWHLVWMQLAGCWDAAGHAHV